MTSQLPTPADRAAAATLVDEVLAGTSDDYRWKHRDRMIRNHATWCKAERERAESKACKAVAAFAQDLARHKSPVQLGVAA
jgi:hypothetical protein